jgi:hypothetical protein
VCANWLPSFSKAERRKCFEEFFLSPHVPRLQAILALGTALEPTPSSRAVTTSRYTSLFGRGKQCFLCLVCLRLPFLKLLASHTRNFAHSLLQILGPISAVYSRSTAVTSARPRPP